MKCKKIWFMFGAMVASFSACADYGVIAEPRRSPEDALKSFLIGVFSKDEQAIRQVILPDPNAAILWQDKSPTKETLAEIPSQFEGITLHECKAGETVELWGERTLVITDEMATETRKLFCIGQDGQLGPQTWELFLVDGTWKVDATHAITETTHARRVARVAQLSRALLVYAKDNDGTLPSKLSDLRDTPPELPLDEYDIVARGRTSDYERPGYTVIVREKKQDAGGKYAAGYLDGHADLRTLTDDDATEDKRVRAVCNVCGAWTEGEWGVDKTKFDAKILDFTVRHLQHESADVSYIYPSDRRYKSLIKKQFEQ